MSSKALIQHFLDIFDPVFTVLDRTHFLEQVENHWSDPHSSTADWVALFLMILGLGSLAGDFRSEVTKDLFLAASGCLSQTPFMFRPSLPNLQTLALMVLAKHATTPSCAGREACWSLLGMLIRMVVGYEVSHPPPPTDSEASPLGVSQVERRVWNMIRYLDLSTSMDTGRPPFLPNEPVPKVEGANLVARLHDSKDPYQDLLDISVPHVTNILLQTNSSVVERSYPEVLRSNSQVREIMGYADQAIDNDIQRLGLDILYRGALLVLHRPYALHPEAPSLFPESYWSSLECSVALFVHQREVFSERKDGQGRDVLGGLFAMVFYSAALTVCNHLLHDDAPLLGETHFEVSIPPRQIILDGLKSFVEIWGRAKDQSPCYQAGFSLLDTIVTAMADSHCA
jgi:hypothetical protein